MAGSHALGHGGDGRRSVRPGPHRVGRSRVVELSLVEVGIIGGPFCICFGGLLCFTAWCIEAIPPPVDDRCDGRCRLPTIISAYPNRTGWQCGQCGTKWEIEADLRLPRDRYRYWVEVGRRSEGRTAPMRLPRPAVQVLDIRSERTHPMHAQNLVGDVPRHAAGGVPRQPSSTALYVLESARDMDRSGYRDRSARVRHRQT